MCLVSVIMITYCHEEFIGEAISGVLMQKCDFEFELIIANDNSPDNTDALIKNILKDNLTTEKIKYIKRDQNVGMMPNLIDALNKATGNYIALCEGDDYWTDPLKLNKQVTFMEANPDFSMCFHAIETIPHPGVPDYSYPVPPKDVLNTKDIINHHYIPTCSLLFRNKYFEQGIPKWFSNSISGDIPLEILLSSKGKTKFLNEKMARYRRHPNSISQSLVQIVKMRSGYIEMYTNLSKEVKMPYYLLLQYKVWRLRLGFAKEFVNRTIFKK